MNNSYNLPPSPEIDNALVVEQLFNATSRRFVEALTEESIQGSYVYITTGYENGDQPVATFSLAQSHEHYRNNEGIVLEISVPAQDAAQKESGLMLLEPLNPDRFVVVKHSHEGQSRSYTISNREPYITPYRSKPRHKFPYKIPKSYPEKLLSQIEEFVLVPARPRNAIADQDT